MPKQDRLNLEPLEQSYDIIAELGDHGDETAYLGRRRADALDVLIRVERTPKGDERNALTLLAADVNALSSLAHPEVVPTIEGRWLGTDAFAIVTERVSAPTLEEVLERGEELNNQRVAFILQQVNDVLEWAREQKIVHRAVSPTSLYVEPDSDRAMVSFVVRPIPLTGAPGAEGDASTIAALAMAMLDRREPSEESDGHGWAERRPDLPKRVIDRTEALLHAKRDAQASLDIPAYIALVAMADPLRQAEDEAARGQQALAEETRQAREELARDRAAFEESAAQRERELEADRELFAENVTREREALAAERAAMVRDVAAERERLAAARADLEQAMVAFAAHRAELERSVIEERVRIAQERRELEARRGRSAAPAGVTATPAADEPIATPLHFPATPVIELPDIPRMPTFAEAVHEPVSGSRVPPEPVQSGPEPAGMPGGHEAGGAHRPNRELWSVLAGAAALVLLVLGTAFGIAHYRSSRGPAPATAATPRPARVDSSAGAVTSATLPVAPIGTSTAAAARPDSSGGRAVGATSAAAPVADSAAATAAARLRRTRRPRPAAVDSGAAPPDTGLFSLPVRRDTARRDTTRRDTTRHVDSVAAPRKLDLRPAAPRADTLKRDTVPRVKPDTGTLWVPDTGLTAAPDAAPLGVTR